MKLVFRRSNGEHLELADVNSIDEAQKHMQAFMDQHNYKSYYMRSWYDPEESCTWFDVGSWSEFFKLYDE